MNTHSLPLHTHVHTRARTHTHIGIIRSVASKSLQRILALILAHTFALILAHTSTCLGLMIQCNIRRNCGSRNLIPTLLLTISLSLSSSLSLFLIIFSFKVYLRCGSREHVLTVSTAKLISSCEIKIPILCRRRKEMKREENKLFRVVL